MRPSASTRTPYASTGWLTRNGVTVNGPTSNASRSVTSRKSSSARHAVRVVEVVGPDHPLGDPCRAVDGNGPGLGPRGSYRWATYRPHRSDAVVRVQVADDHGVEVARRSTCRCSAPSDAVAEVEDQVPGAALVLGPHQVAGRGRARPRQRPGAPDDGQPHRLATASAVAVHRPPGPRNRRASRSNSAGVPGRDELVGRAAAGRPGAARRRRRARGRRPWPSPRPRTPA